MGAGRSPSRSAPLPGPPRREAPTSGINPPARPRFALRSAAPSPRVAGGSDLGTKSPVAGRAVLRRTLNGRLTARRKRRLPPAGPHFSLPYPGRFFSPRWLRRGAIFFVLGRAAAVPVVSAHVLEVGHFGLIALSARLSCPEVAPRCMGGPPPACQRRSWSNTLAARHASTPPAAAISSSSSR